MVKKGNAANTDAASINSQTIPVQVQRLQEIADGDLDFERELIQAFVLDNERHIRSLESAISERNLELFEHVAHSMKGSSANMGANRMLEIAHLLEQLGPRGELSPANEMLDNLKTEFNQVCIFLEDYLNSR